MAEAARCVQLRTSHGFADDLPGEPDNRSGNRRGICASDRRANHRRGVGTGCIARAIRSPSSTVRRTTSRVRWSRRPPMRCACALPRGPGEGARGPRVHLVLGISNDEAMDTVIRQVSELGVAGVLPYRSTFSPSFPPSRGDELQSRWQHLAHYSARQAGLAKAPDVGFPETLDEMCKTLEGFDAVVVCWECETARSMADAVAELGLADAGHAISRLSWATRWFDRCRDGPYRPEQPPACDREPRPGHPAGRDCGPCRPRIAHLSARRAALGGCRCVSRP